ncbi:hypothetical protein ACF1BS_14920 [Streptomyces sp. NPDC014748]|uniref:hypothetical protein n=1 Tax=Streptomyces sp. NPDC014748 TaxID=3364905 RepID=UPI0036FB34A1
MTLSDAPVTGVPAGRQRDRWLPVSPLAVPTVWMATPEGLVCLDLIAVELAANGLRKGWTLTSDEARYTASLLLERGVPYSVVAQRVGASGATLREWFPEQACPVDERLARPRPSKPKPEPKPVLPVRCGTMRGYRQHQRRREPACGLCKAARRAADRHFRRHGTYVGAPEVAA